MATRERVEDGGVAVPRGGRALGVSVGAKVAVGAGATVGDAVALGAAVGDGAVVDVAVGAAVGVLVPVPKGGRAFGPAVEVGGGMSVGLLGEQAAASSPAAKALNAWRKLRRERGLLDFIMGESTSPRGIFRHNRQVVNAGGHHDPDDG